MTSNSFRTVITKPTRISDSTSTLIDHIWINDMSNDKIESKIILCDITDHLPTVYIKYNKTKLKGYTKIQYRPLTESNIIKFKNRIIELNTFLIDLASDTSVAANERVTNYFSNIYNECFPLKSKKIHNKTLGKPWINQELQRLINKKNRLYGKKMKHKTIGRIARYRECKKDLKHKLKLSKYEYFRNKLSNSSNNMKAKWDVIRLIINRQKNNMYIPIKSQVLGEHYSSVASKLTSKLPNLSQDDIPSTSAAGESVCSHKAGGGTFSFTNIAEREVHETLLKLDTSKGPGPDDFHVKVLKEVGTTISSHLSILFNKCIDDGVYPANFKISKTIALFKGGNLDPNDPVSYRPISILNTVNKVFERLLHNQLYYYLECHNLIPEFQYGYRKNHSTCHAILDFVKEIETTLDQNEVAVSIFMDLSKAFDTVDKNILCSKLKKLGVSTESVNIIYSYMSNRYFYMNNDGSKTSFQMNYGVPQGSILGPLLFLVYIYDMTDIATYIKSIVYADDTTLIIKGRSITEAVQRANAILDRYYNYFCLNKLTVNESKTKYMIFTRKGNAHNKTTESIVINNYILEQVSSIKFLGVIINDRLNWTEHKSYTRNKILKCLGVLYKCRQVMNLDECINMYNSFILPYLLYCLPVWGGSLRSLTDPIIKTQNQVLRILTYTRRTTDAWSYVSNTVLPIGALYKLEISKYCHKFIVCLLFNFSSSRNIDTYIQCLRLLNWTYPWRLYAMMLQDCRRERLRRRTSQN